MKRIVVLLTLALAGLHVSAQDVTGDWSGILKVQTVQLRIVFHVKKTVNGYGATMDSPDQGATGIPVTSTTYENSILTLNITNIGVEYSGEYKGDSITGTYKQSGLDIPLVLTREMPEKETLNRPQEPQPPFSYEAEDVTFPNRNAGITLAGTLTLPEKNGNFPVVILITGSGAQDRNEEILGHKPFLVIADYLTRNGIAVLRYDDRGFGQSTGNFAAATSEDLASDVESAIAYLKTRPEIDTNNIGLIGHSEGGIIAPMVAARNEDVSFIVLLAGTGIRGDKLLLIQQELIARASGATRREIRRNRKTNVKAFDMVLKASDPVVLKQEITSYIKKTFERNSDVPLPAGMTEEEYINMQVEQITSPWMVFFLKYDPAIALEKVKCPVLAINGGKDLQVPPEVNLTAIRNALEKGGNRQVTVRELPGLNHLFQECNTGSPDEYGTIEQTFSPAALEVIGNWIKAQIR